MENNTKTHISYSELKDWNQCPHYHRKNWIEKVAPFQGSEHTAFGTAVHEACEKKLLNESQDDVQVFNLTFRDKLEELMKNNVDLDQNLIGQMEEAAPEILNEIKPSLDAYFGEYEVFACEEKLYEPIEDLGYNFKGFIDAIVKTGDEYHIFDWKTCSWGWDAKRKSDKMVTYQLTLYKHFFCQKHNIDPSKVHTHFSLLKRTAKKDRVEFFRVTSGEKKTDNALKLLRQAVYNIQKGTKFKNRLSCTKPYRCKLYKTEHCR